MIIPKILGAKMSEDLFDSRYKIVGKTREGGMSLVYPAQDSISGNLCAIKLNRPDADPVLGPVSFDAEYLALSNLNHKNIVRVVDIGATADRKRYMVLEWVPERLHDRILEVGPMSWEEFLVDIGFPLLSALSHAHNRKVAHRDLKPKNVLLASDGTPKIGDFGIARNMEKSLLEHTLRGAGSIPYTPAEWDDGIHSYGRDCYSWAAIAISCMTGRIFGDLGELEEALASLPKDKVPIEILTKALSNSPAKRFLIAGDLAGAVEGAFRQRVADGLASTEIRVTFALNVFQSCMATWEISDIEAAKARVLEDLNEVCAAEVLTQLGIIRLIGASVLAEGEIAEPLRDRIRITRIQILSAPRAESGRSEAILLPGVKFTEKPEIEQVKLVQAIRLLTAYLEKERAKRDEDQLLLAKERIFELFSAVLREKERFYRSNKISFPFKAFRGQAPIFVATLEGEVEPSKVGESLVIGLPNQRYVAFDVLDIQFDQLRLKHRFGPVDSVPKTGVLETNRAAEIQSLSKQRIALEQIRSGKALSPALFGVVCQPSTSRIPEKAGLPAKLGDLSPDKHIVLDKALGVQDALVVEGPPGTGKTTLIAELIAQYLSRYPLKRILLSSQTHVALDHVLSKLRSRGMDDALVRITRNQEAKVDQSVAPLLLTRKTEKWASRTEARARDYIGRYAERLGFSAQEIRAGILGEERIVRLERIQRIREELGELEIEEQEIERARQDRAANQEKISVDTLIEETSTLADRRNALETELAAQQAAEQRIREQLAQCGDFGAEIAKANLSDAEQWVSALLPDSEDARQFKQLVRLQYRWLERLGASQELIPAVLGEAKVVAGTCVGIAGMPAIYEDEYDLCIIDEASKATATESLIPMARSLSWILVGDPKQLPPFLDAGFKLNVDGFDETEVNMTLLDHFLDELPHEAKERISEQRRMTKGIGELVSAVFYERKLDNKRKDSDRDPLVKRVFPKPVTWISTSRANAKEDPLAGHTFRNRVECDVIVQKIQTLSKASARREKPITVAVISGYAGQVRALKDAIQSIPGGTLGLTIECNTVDAFQGKDADVCFYSVTRTDSLGFQRKKPRLNVALSRARDALVIVGDVSFCRSSSGENPFPPVIEFIESNPSYCELAYYE